MGTDLQTLAPTKDRPPAAMIDLPSNIELEAVILGAMMLPEMEWFIEYCADRMTAAAFYEPIHGRIYEAIQRQHALGKSASPVLLRSYFTGDDGLTELGGFGYLARLTGDPIISVIAHRQCAKDLLDLANRRRIMTALRDAYDNCADPTGDLAEIVSGVDTAIDKHVIDTVVESDAAECMDAFLGDLDAEHVGVKCHRIEPIDDLLGALEPKSLTILAARPGMGKTAVATNYALGAARAGHGVCFVSLEMSREQLSGRMVADVGFDSEDRRIPYSAIQGRTLNPVQRDRVQDIAGWIGRLPLAVIDAGSLKIGRLERLIRKQKRRMIAKGSKLELVVIDYLQLLHCDDKKRSPYEAISEISMRLKAMAKDHGIAILALAQLSRVVETRADKKPILSDLRDSGQIEQDADAVLFLLRQEYYVHQGEPYNDPDKHAAWEAELNRCRGVIEFILAKRRNGTTGSARGRFYGAYQAVR